MSDLKRSIKLTLLFMLILGIIYPLTMTGLSRLIFPEKSKGSLVYNNGVLIGSTLIGQKFTDNRWFQGRPSTVDYNALNSGGSNLSMSNPEFKKEINKNIEDFLIKNPTVKKEDIPAEMVTSSASGLDPDITVASARLQAKRVAKANGLSLDEVNRIIDNNKNGKFLGIFGQERVNVLTLNMKLLNK